MIEKKFVWPKMSRMCLFFVVAGPGLGFADVRVPSMMPTAEELRASAVPAM